MNLKPWYKVMNPREDLREGKPLDASEFAVHLDKVREGKAPADYQQPHRFFARTYLTKNLVALASEVIRRLSGERTETNAVFNLATQFGGGKTHALTLLYHLANGGPEAGSWTGVSTLLGKARVPVVPKAAVAVFVGTEFDSIAGRGGSDGTPHRKTPWGEIAFQLGGMEAFAIVAEHDARGEAPGGEVIRRFLPRGRPSLILMDELMNYVSRNRRSGLTAQLYNFVHNLSEVARGEDHVVLAVSIPASEMEMTAEDQSDYERFKKVLDRVGKAMVMSAEAETSEIIRRRLFEWDPEAVNGEGKVLLNKDALQTCAEYADWVVEHRQQLPSQFNADGAREAFAATYPFHPALISVFERKWQALHRFQQTRGMLRLLALWVSHAFHSGFKGAHKDPLIGLGTAPMDDATFRSALFEQLGETKLETAVTTDILGKRDSHAERLDAEAVDAIKSTRLHQKVATSIFFESNGGQARAEATQPEIRFAVADPSLDIGNVETVLEALAERCYYLTVERNRYRFSLRENLNKRFVDRRATVPPPHVEERVQEEITKVFGPRPGVERVCFPEKTIQIVDRPALTFVVMGLEQSMDDEKAALGWMEKTIREYGSSSRTYKSAVIFCVPESAGPIREEARKVLAWEAIQDDDLKLDESQRAQLSESHRKALRDLKEVVWRSYKNLVLLGKDNALRRVDLGLIHSSAATDIWSLILERLRADGDLVSGVSPGYLIRNWPPAFKEWSTKSVRDAFFASPQLTRLTSPEVLRDTISRGVGNGDFACVGKTTPGDYKPFWFKQALPAPDVEVSDDVFLLPREAAEAYLKQRANAAQGTTSTPTPSVPAVPSAPPTLADISPRQPALPIPTPPSPSNNPGGDASTLHWTGDVPSQKWMNFYTKVLTRFASVRGLRLTVKIEVSPEGGLSQQKVEETKASLRELGLNDQVEVRKPGAS